MLGLVFGAALRFLPWLAAPGFSLCYFLFFLAFASDFSVATLFYPTSLACYALLAPTKPGPRFWLVALVYTELLLVVGYVVSIPCALECVDWTMCEDRVASAWGLPGTRDAAGTSFIRGSLAPLAVYVAVLLHRFALLQRGEGRRLEAAAGPCEATEGATNRRGEAVVGEGEEEEEDARRGGDPEGRPREAEGPFEGSSRGTPSGSFVAGVLAGYDAAEAFFQRVLSADAERRPSFVAVTVARPAPGAPFSAPNFFSREDEFATTADASAPPSSASAPRPRPRPSSPSSSSGGVAWDEVGAALNVALGAVRVGEGAQKTAAAGDPDALRLRFVEADLARARGLPGFAAAEHSDSFSFTHARERRGKDDDSGGSKDESRRSLHEDSSRSLSRLGADHRTAVFLVTAESGRVLEPAREAARGIEAAQLRVAAEGSRTGGGGGALFGGLGLKTGGGGGFVFPDVVSVLPFARGGKDYYFATCCADMAALVFVLLFYQFTVNADPEALVETYHQGLFPIDYVLAVTATVALLILDRVAYLNKAKAFKAAYHFCTYAGFATFAFRLFHHQLGALRATDAGRAGLLRLFFLLKSLGFALNAAQLRSGYKRDVSASDGLHARSDFLSFLGFQAYLSVPFVYELRVLLDYACTDSALDLFDWLKLENVNRDLFRINVRNETYRRYHPFGAPQPRWKKVLVQGGGIFVLLLGVVLAPFFIFSTSNPQVGVNPVYRAELNVTVASADGSAAYPILRGGFRAHLNVPEEWNALRLFSSDDDKDLQRAPGERNTILPPTPAPYPPVNYKSQIQEICVAPESDATWSLPGPALDAFNDTVLAPGSTVTARWTFYRRLPLDNQVLFAQGPAVPLDRATARAFAETLDGRRKGVVIRNLYPRAWRLLGNGGPVSNYTTRQQMDCELSLESEADEDEAGGEATKASSASSRARALRWWSARCGVEEAGATNPSNPSSGDASSSSSSSGESGGGSDSGSDTGGSLPGPRSKNWHSPCGSFGGGPEVVLVSSEVATGALASFSKLVGGLTGMYVVYVLAVGSFARSFTTNLVTQIPYVDLPSTHRLAALCEDIYAMRRAREFVLEERLYWLLIRVYRSPAVLFEFTRTKGGGALPERPLRRNGPKAAGKDDREGGARRSRKDDRSESKDRRIGDGGDGGDGLRRRAGRTDATE